MWVAMRSRNQRSWLMITAQPAKSSSASSSARSVSTSRSLVGSSSSSTLAPDLQHLGEVHAVALAAGELADLLLLVGALEVERARHRRASSPRCLPSRMLSWPPEISSQTFFLPSSAVARLVDVAELHRLADLDRAGVGLLLAGDHAEQRGLAGAVRADHADDAAGRQLEGEVVDQQVVAVALLAGASKSTTFCPSRSADRDDDLRVPGSAWLGDLRQQLLVALIARLRLGLPRLGRGGDPFAARARACAGAPRPRGPPAAAASASAPARTSSCPRRECRVPRSSSRIQPVTLSRK